MAVVRRGGRPARTRYRLLKSFAHLSLLEVRLETGRTHQIRVHLSHIGFPVFGDPTYGGGRRFLPRIAPPSRSYYAERLRCLNRQALHAYHLSLRHPRDHRRWVFEVPVPEDLDSLLRGLTASAGGNDEI
jgi:23S rRNA pseudouridine1911/1915/1917 synthase